MSLFPRIESRQNPRVKNLVKLRSSRERAAQGCFLIEGELEMTRALTAGVTVVEVYVCPSHWRDEATASTITAQAEKQCAIIHEVTPEVFARISLREGPDGLLAVASCPQDTLARLDLPENPLVVVVEKIEKPGNLGALIRTAEAAGADAVIACDAVTDFLNPQVIRNSRGLVFTLPCVAASREEIDAFLQQNRLSVAATTPAANLDHWDADLRGPLAILAGAEHDGLSEYWLSRADRKLRIPMAGSADSLNVNVATAVVLFEALRQRR